MGQPETRSDLGIAKWQHEGDKLCRRHQQPICNGREVYGAGRDQLGDAVMLVVAGIISMSPRMQVRRGRERQGPKPAKQNEFRDIALHAAPLTQPHCSK